MNALVPADRLLGQHDPVVGPSPIVGDSPAMQSVLAAVQRAAAGSSRTVLLTGEAGTGRQHAARALHALSPAASGRFVRVEQPEARELPSLARAAAGGVLFVRELGTLGMEAQAWLLRLLEEPAEVRVIAATGTDPGALVAARRVRADLLHRLEASTIRLPALRERRADIPLLVEHFLGSFCSRKCGCIWGVAREAQDALGRHDWPGNVRELRSAVEHAVTAGTTGWIELIDLPAQVRGPETADMAEGRTPGLPTLAEAEARLIRLTVLHHGGNKLRAAKSLGISRHRLYEKLRRLGLHEPGAAVSGKGPMSPMETP